MFTMASLWLLSTFPNVVNWLRCSSAVSGRAPSNRYTPHLAVRVGSVGFFSGYQQRNSLAVPHNTEPMMLGSPTSPVTQHSQSQYLPGYLLGESSHSHHALSPGPKMWTSPPRGSTVHGRGSGSLTSPSLTGPTGITPRPDMTSPRAKDKLGAPPVKRLASDLGSTPGSGANSPFLAGNAAAFKPMSMSGHMMTPVSRAMTSTPALQTSGISQSFNTSTAGGPEVLYGSVHIPASPAQLDPFYTQGENLTSDDVLDDTWVTVFGFPPSATSFILQQFSQYGNIIKHTTSSDGNWMHLHYQSKIQAKKALSANGKVFGGSIMVGVSRCIDKSVMEDDKENIVAAGGGYGSRLGTPNISRLHTSHLEASSLPCSARNTPSIRPLTAAYQSARKEHEVVQSGNIPQKSTNIVSKAMEYVFGW